MDLFVQAGDRALRFAADLLPHRRVLDNYIQLFAQTSFPNPQRGELATFNLGDPAALIESAIQMPQGPGLGIEIEATAIARFRADR
jgi:L-alanine-DL-glutamate epimerase-like enolase superfamily enzyme